MIAVVFSLSFLAGCGDGGEHDDLPPAALALVEDEAEESEGRLPHTVDTATEFESAIDSLAKGAKQPNVRANESHVVSVVRVEKSEKAIGAAGGAAINSGAAGGAAINSDKVTEAVAPKRIEQDWSGIVLLPDRRKMSKAYTTDVRLDRIEAHPLKDERLRVWVRVANTTDRPMEANVACNFRNAERKSMKTDFAPVMIPVEEAIDVYFMSPMTEVVSYTILVR